jgi:hypothetical protein
MVNIFATTLYFGTVYLEPNRGGLGSMQGLIL